MTLPTVVRIESRQAAGDHDVPSVATLDDAQEGDVCLMVTWGVANGAAAASTVKPTYTSGGADAGFESVAGSPVNSGNTDGRVYAWWKKLEAADFGTAPSTDLKQFKSPDSPTLGMATSKRTSIWIFHHPNGWDDTIFSIYTDTAGFTNNVAQTLNGAGAPTRPNVSVFLFAISGASSSLQINWDGAGGREPYVDESSAFNPFGGHGAVVHAVSVTSGTNSGTHTTLTANDVGSIITGGGLAAGATIATVNVGAGTFTVNGTFTSAGAINVNVTPHYGSAVATGLTQADYKTYDTGAGATSFALSIGSGSTHAVMVVTFQTGTGSVQIDGGHAIAELVPHAGAITPVIGGGHAIAKLVPHAGNIAGHITGQHATALLVPHAGSVSHGVEVQGGHATMLLIPHPQGGFVFDSYDWIIPPPTSVHVRSARLLVVAKKLNVGDSGDIRLTLLQDPGGTIIAEGGWQPLGNAYQEYELTIDGPTWEAIADPTQLAGLATFRRQEEQTLEWDVDYAALIPAYFVQALLVPHAGNVNVVKVDGNHATMLLVPHGGSVTVPHRNTNFLPFFTA